MKLAITGAGGLLGQNILQILKETDNTVYAFSSQGDLLRSTFSGAKNFYFLDMTDEIPDGIDVLIHCAFPRNEDGEQMAAGLKYIRDIFCQCVEKKVGAVINISSQSVYSQSRDFPADENSVLNLESKYAVGKYASELLLNKICQSTCHTNIRMASLIGAEFHQRIVNKFVKTAFTEKELTVLAGAQSYGYMDVRDAADALVTMCLSSIDPRQWEESYNLGIENTYSLIDIASEVKRQVEAELGSKIKLNIKKHEARLNTALNSQRFYQTFDWRPGISLQKTVQDILRKEC